ncbi:MAG: IMP cyclohydrolase [Desulfonatronovibrionaceae bacterium]
MDLLSINRALISLTDKSGSAELGRFLQNRGVEIVSTGGTLKELEKAGVRVVPVSQVTAFPEILDGRVKTLHPRVHGGVLANKDDPGHMAVLKEMDIRPFDLICVNLYDFNRAVDEDMDLTQAVEQIDIGGPALLRAGAKNLNSVCVLPSPDFYPEFMHTLEKLGKVTLELRKKTAEYTFKMTSEYDRMIAAYLSGQKA